MFRRGAVLLLILFTGSTWAIPDRLLEAAKHLDINTTLNFYPKSKYDAEKDKWMSYCSGCGYTGWSKHTKVEFELMLIRFS